MSTARVDFTRGAAERIANVVRIVEQGDRDGDPLTFRKVGAEGGGGKVFRVCTFTGNWTKNTLKTITFKYQTTTPNTLMARNLFAEITLPTSTVTAFNCAVGKEGTAWYLIAAECP